MGKSVADYHVVGICAGGGTIEGKMRGAPTEDSLCAWGKQRRCLAVIRYFPSRRGWRILDIRSALPVLTRNSRVPFWRGQRRGERYYPTLDAAVMVALHTLV